MKKLILSGIVLFSAVFAIMAFTFPVVDPSGYRFDPQQDTVVSAFPENVAKILEISCNECHGDASSNKMALLKVNFSKWDGLTASKKVGKLQNIVDVVEKNVMPPSKFIAKNPDKAPGQEQKDIIIRWAKEESEKLMGK